MLKVDRLRAGKVSRMKQPLARRIKSLRIAQLLAMCAMLCLCECSFAKEKLYEGPTRPPSELVSFVVYGDSFTLNLDILINGKWQRVRSGSQVLPGSYEVRLLSMCGQPLKYPPDRPPVDFYSFYLFHDSFTAAAGDTVTYLLAGGQFPYVNQGRKGYTENFRIEIVTKPMTICYGAWGAYHTVTKGSVQEPDDIHSNMGIRGPAATQVLNYIDALGRQDQSASMSFLSNKCAGDLRSKCDGVFEAIFPANSKDGWRYSATNTKIFDEIHNTTGDIATVVADVIFTSGPLSFRDYEKEFTLVLENGSWKISK